AIAVVAAVLAVIAAAVPLAIKPSPVGVLILAAAVAELAAALPFHARRASAADLRPPGAAELPPSTPTRVDAPGSAQGTDGCEQATSGRADVGCVEDEQEDVAMHEH